MPRAMPAIGIACTVAAAAMGGSAEAGAQVRLSEAGSQVRVGLSHHDLDGYGGSESGADLSVEYRWPPIRGAFFEKIFSPRPHLGANFNTIGETSSFYAGLTWLIDIGTRGYASVDFGGAVHNGKLNSDDPGRAQLGSRALFREAVEIGLRVGEASRVGFRLDHISNADLAGENDGITDLGIMYTRSF